MPWAGTLSCSEMTTLKTNSETETLHSSLYLCCKYIVDVFCANRPGLNEMPVKENREETYRLS